MFYLQLSVLGAWPKVIFNMFKRSFIIISLIPTSCFASSGLSFSDRLSIILLFFLVFISVVIFFIKKRNVTSINFSSLLKAPKQNQSVSISKIDQFSTGDRFYLIQNQDRHFLYTVTHSGSIHVQELLKPINNSSNHESP